MTAEVALAGPQHFDTEGTSPRQASLHTHPSLCPHHRRPHPSLCPHQRRPHPSLCPTPPCARTAGGPEHWLPVTERGG